MNRKGFTLLELLAVIAVVGIVSVAAVVSFANIEKDTEEEELRNKYAEIQRAANLYMDLHNSSMSLFMEQNYIDIKLGTLDNENYLTSDLSNPVTGDDISIDYYVRIYISGNVDDDKQSVKSCIIDKTASGIVCIANDLGEYENLGDSCCK